eukprot:TRINITY_DN18_c0_g1_i1.p1 TRINITY_DN18_c0_g1~~TRINITY_DN18_c0_g1_i1.p1  ORF type:complete len:975 (+),score=125.62 TRINITY_DN18_c0_g1_i1:13597-16521(+)
MVTRHGPLESSKEPQAFRIRRPSNRESAIYSNSPLPQESSPLTKFNFRREREHFQEPTSWLERSELTSESFDAHDFLQRSILQRHDRNGTKIPHLPLLDSSVEADTALAMLDTVETTLRAHRDESIKEELLARDRLKRALHASSTKREELSTTALKVRANVVTFGAAGKQAVKALQEGVLSLNEHIASLALLVEARDLLALLTDQASELDALHVSKLLAKASKILGGESIRKRLSANEREKAKSEVHACQKELIDSIFIWMREGVATAKTVIVRDCALAASELGVYNRFVQEYISHVVSNEQLASSCNILPSDTTGILKHFKQTCSDAISIFRRLISAIVDAFSDPSLPLRVLVRLITEKVVFPRAIEIVNETKKFVENGSNQDRLKSYKAQKSEEWHTISRSSKHLSLNTESLDTSIPKASEYDDRIQKNEQLEKKKYLVLSAAVFKVLASYRSDVQRICRDLGRKVADSVFATGENPVDEFVYRQAPIYLELEKKWIDDQLAIAFLDISYIESSLPPLAPTEHCDPQIFHQYARLYTAIIAKFKDMTSTAIDFSSESIDRLSDISLAFTQGLFQGIMQNCSETENQYPTGFVMGCTKSDMHVSSSSLDIMESRLADQRGHSKSAVNAGSEDSAPVSVHQKLTVLVRDVTNNILRSLMMIYVANAETVLQAAAPLLPICEEDAVREELWRHSSSPLTAYAAAVEKLSQANELMAKFLLNLKNIANGVKDPQIMIDAEINLCHLVSQETRDVLHTELTSGLSDLGAEAEQGITSAIRAMGLRLAVILSAPGAAISYSSLEDHHCQALSGSFEESRVPTGTAKPKPSKAFVEVCSFLEHQIRFIVRNIKGCNREFILSEIGALTRDAVLKCWCSCPSQISLTGAIQMIADSRIVLKAFENHVMSVEAVRCLPSLAQLFLETPEGLWACIENTTLANVDARILVGFLRRRPDSRSRDVIRICQSLGATEEELADEL